MNKKIWFLCISYLQITQLIQAAPLGLFEPYDINIRLRKPGQNNFYVGVLGEKSYDVKGYATDACEEATIEVNPLQIYEPQQNFISLYQGVNPNNSEFIQLINSIAGGPGGGVSNYENGLFIPCGNLKAEQLAISTIYGLPRNFYIGTYLPLYSVQLDSVHWKYAGNSILFSGQEIQELVDAFEHDAKNLFGLSTKNWKRQGAGDLTLLMEWQRDFSQIRPVLKNVQPNVRFGISIPVGCKTNQNIIMPVPFGADGSISIPFGGGLTMNLATNVDVGFSGQFWYYLNNEKERRIKTFETQTSLLYPITTRAIIEYAFLQNFNLFAQAYCFGKRLSVKFCYQYWRKGDDRITPIDTLYNFEIANTAPQLLETTAHDVFFTLTYGPKQTDFKRVIPQAQLFWKASVKGMRAALASTAGFQFAIVF